VLRNACTSLVLVSICNTVLLIPTDEITGHDKDAPVASLVELPSVDASRPQTPQCPRSEGCGDPCERHGSSEGGDDEEIQY
jgi:hypothetical protein